MSAKTTKPLPPEWESFKAAAAEVDRTLLRWTLARSPRERLRAATVLHGAPTATYDLDIVHRRTPENVERLLAVLAKLDAYFREPLQRRLRPKRVHLAGGGQLRARREINGSNLGDETPAWQDTKAK